MKQTFKEQLYEVLENLRAPMHVKEIDDLIKNAEKRDKVLEILKKRINQNIDYCSDAEKEVHIHFTITGDEINKINEWLEVIE